MAGVNMETLEDIQADFTAASFHVKSIISKLTRQQALQFYGLFKQATEGPCFKQKPSLFELNETQKWEAWSSLKDLDSIKAKQLYINMLNSFDPKWKEKPIENISGWVHHSCMRNNEEIIKDCNKTIFDWVKEKNLAQVKTKGSIIMPEINNLDNNGLSLLHWASDRGSLEIVKYLVEHLNADVNIKDGNGQTPLHYAVYCEHDDIAKYLLEAGANRNLTDNDGKTPYETN